MVKCPYNYLRKLIKPANDPPISSEKPITL